MYCLCCGKELTGKQEKYCSRHCNKKYAKMLKNRIGDAIGGAHIMRQGNRFTNDEGFSARITAKSSRFEYLCKCDDKKFLYLICTDCGNVVRKTKESIKPSRTITMECPHCKEIIKRINERQKEKEQEEKHRIAEEERRKAREAIEKKLEEKRQTIIYCERCGKPFEKGNRFKYCSDRCAQRQYYSTKEHLRRARIKTKNDAISLDKLRIRDKDTCWICNKKCMPNDYVIRDGAFIVGDKYPSIDHVIALRNGGTHTWSNVRLAHFKCNSLKSAKLYYEEKNGQISMFV